MKLKKNWLGGGGRAKPLLGEGKMPPFGTAAHAIFLAEPQPNTSHNSKSPLAKQNFAETMNCLRSDTKLNFRENLTRTTGSAELAKLLTRIHCDTP